MTGPEDICNRALDLIGSGFTISDIQEGSREAAAALRIYTPVVHQMLRAHDWNFARKTWPLIQLKSYLDTNPSVPVPWLFEYEYPVDCLRLRYLPAYIPNAFVNGPPPMTGLGFGQTDWWWGGWPWRYPPDQPAPFVVGTDNLTPQLPPRTVILTNVSGAIGIYTAAIMVIELWDDLFTEAVVARLAASLAMICLDDKKFAMTLRTQQVALAEAMLKRAEVRDGNEGWLTQDHMPDWMSVRGTSDFADGIGPYGYGSSPTTSNENLTDASQNDQSFLTGGSG